MPIAVLDFQVVTATVLRLENVELRNVQHNSLPVGGRDSPLALVSTVGEKRGVEGGRRGGEGARAFLECASAACNRER